MYVLLGETTCTFTEHHRVFHGRKSAVDKLPHDEWVIVTRKAAKVDRQMATLQCAHQWYLDNDTDEQTIKQQNNIHR